MKNWMKIDTGGERSLPEEETNRHATIRQGQAFLADLELLEA